MAERQEALTLPYNWRATSNGGSGGKTQALRASGRRTCRDLALLLRIDHGQAGIERHSR